MPVAWTRYAMLVQVRRLPVHSSGSASGSGGKLWQYRGYLCVGVLGEASI